MGKIFSAEIYGITTERSIRMADDDRSAAVDEKPQSSNQNFDSTKRSGEIDSDVDNISYLENCYIAPKHRKLSAGLKKIDKCDAKRYQLIQNVIDDARETYSVEYVRLIISIAKKNCKMLNDFDLSDTKEKYTLNSIANLQNFGRSVEAEELERLQHAIEYICNLEDRLFHKGLLKKMSPILRLSNKISKEGGEIG